MAKRPAKSRKGARKSASSKRPATRRKAASTREPRRPRKSLPLKQLRADLDLAIATLSRRVEVPGAPSGKVSQAITIFTRWAADIDAICGDSAAASFCGPSMDPFAAGA